MGKWARMAGAATLLGAAAFYGCTGSIGDPPAAPDPNAELAVISGARRLTRAEYDASLRDLLMDTSNSGFAFLPEDVSDPFDNDYHTQKVSPALIEAAEALARDAAARAVADPAVLAAIVPCTPSGPGDEACLRAFIASWGRRALRRPLGAAEIDRYVTAFLPFAQETGDFNTGVSLVIQAILQDVEFLYRIELGEPVPSAPGVFRLNDYEVATRLSFFLLGTTPPDELLDLAAADGLSSPEDVRAAAVSLLERQEARARVDRFHALWLSYHQLPHSPDLTAALREESRRLVERTVFDEGVSYLDLFRSEDTYLTPTLAAHYGYSAGGEGWFTYPDERRGLLSHGSVLSAGAKFDDTSPTQRGKFVRMRLLCEPEPKPPPDVNVDEPPASTGPDDCKLDRYKAHRSGGCANCHLPLDEVGFGLERYNTSGQYREFEEGRPECPIDGVGNIPDLGEFSGPAQLAELLLDSGRLEDCIVRQVYRFAHGRREQAEDSAALSAIADGFTESVSFKQMLLDVVSSPAFGYRRQEEAP